MTSPATPEPALVQVREAWRVRSLASVWLRPGDWYQPVVDDVVLAVTLDVGVLDAVEALGAARAEHGVGIGETLDDLTHLFRVLEDGPPPIEAVRALCEGWAAPGGPGFVATTCMDPESGLPTAEYLAVRLREAYGVARRRGGTPEQDLRLLLVDVARDGVAPWDRLARSAAAGRAIEVAFGEGHPAASLGGGVFAVLLERARVDDALATLAHQIEVVGRELGVTDVLRRPPRLWVEPLPREHRDAVALLTTRRPAPGPIDLAGALLPRSPFGPEALPPYQGAGTIPPFSPEPLPPTPRPGPETVDPDDDAPGEV